MHRLLFLLIFLLLNAFAPESRSFEGEQAPNILLIFADDQRADTIGAWGNPFIHTPNIDGLVEKGVSFRRNYCLGSMHGAVCVPSRAMLHTGRDYHGLDVSNFEGSRTLGEALREVGYQSFATGKWHNGREAFKRSFDSAKAVMFGGMSNHREVPAVDMEDASFVNQRVGAKHSSELFADAAVEFLRQAKGDQPFFCYVAFTAPHDPRDPPRPFAERYYDDRPPLPRNFMAQHPFDNGMMVLRDEVLGPWPRTKDVVSDQLAEYYGLITHMDEQIGRLLEALRAGGHAQNTLVVFAADHGLAVGSHGLLGKQSVYEHSLRAPLVIAGPEVPQGRSSVALTYLLDLYPTLLNYAGAKPDEGIEGRDLAPLWNGKAQAVRDSLYLSMSDSQRAVTDGRWKLIRYPQIDHTQLFDLASDPDELLNLASNPEQAERVESLWKELERWQNEIGDPLPLRVAEPKAAEIDFGAVKRQPDRWQPRWIRRKYFGLLD